MFISIGLGYMGNHEPRFEKGKDPHPTRLLGVTAVVAWLALCTLIAVT